MLIQNMMTELEQLNLKGMAACLHQLSLNSEHLTLTLTESLNLMIHQEKTFREHRKYERLMKQAKLRYLNATLEQVDYHSKRQLNKQQFLLLAQGDWLSQNRNLILLGATGLGKSYLACVLGNQACRLGASVRYYRLTHLLEQMRIARANGTYLNVLNQLGRVQLLILDDMGMEPMQGKQAHDLFEIIEEKYQRGSLLLVSQLPLEHWHSYLGDPTIADAILDRLIPQSEKIILKGESLRKQSKNQTGEKNNEQVQ